MFEASFIFVLKIITLVVCCLYLVAPFLLVFRFLVALLHDFRFRQRKEDRIS